MKKISGLLLIQLYTANWLQIKKRLTFQYYFQFWEQIADCMNGVQWLRTLGFSLHYLVTHIWPCNVMMQKKILSQLILRYIIVCSQRFIAFICLWNLIGVQHLSAKNSIIDHCFICNSEIVLMTNYSMPSDKRHEACLNRTKYEDIFNHVSI